MNTYTRHTPIWVSDRPTGSVLMLFEYNLLGSTLNMDSDLYQNRHFLRQKWTEIRFLVQPQQVNHNDRSSDLLRDG